MKSNKSIVAVSAAAFAMIILILDAKTALSGAKSGVELCCRTVIPALFPFLVLSAFLTGNLFGESFPFLLPLGKLCRIPRGAEPILLTGILGGYPVGAQCITQAFRSGQLSRKSAYRLLGFCSNAGPAFIFGMLSPLFDSSMPVCCLWGIHILSALITAVILPGTCEERITLASRDSVSLSDALQRSLRTMASICGWVILFRILIDFFNRWFLWLLPDAEKVLFIGILELTNGCTALTDLDSAGIRFILCALFLGFGGICVGMQTVSVTGALGTGLYFPGKIVQSAVSLLLAVPVQRILFPEGQRIAVSPIVMLFAAGCIGLLCICLKNRKNSSSNLELQGV